VILHSDYLLSHLILYAGGKELPGRFSSITPPAQKRDPETTFYRFEIEYPLFTNQVPSEVTIFQSVSEKLVYGPGQPWTLSYIVSIDHPPSSTGSSWLLREGETLTLPTGLKGESSSRRGLTPTALEYLHLGVIHILTGYDHLLFVSALVLATLTLWDLVKVVAAFTLAHSLTLTLSVFGIIRLPSSLVEPLISVSIIAVALLNIFRPKPSENWIRLSAAFGFGLVHGLGFAGGLIEAMQGLPQTGIWIAIASFSTGVEIGNMAVILPLFGALLLLRVSMKSNIYRGLTITCSSLVALAGIFYLLIALQDHPAIQGTF
jgi:hydrogenase/urease accessory protein HupE